MNLRQCVAAALLAALAQTTLAIEETTITPKELTGTAVRNPDKGWLLYSRNLPLDSYSPSALSLASAAVWRFEWAEIEPSENDFNWNLIDDALTQCARWGLKCNFGVMSANSGSTRAYVTPKWVFDAGARSVNVPEPKKPHTLPIATTQMVPVFDDPVFLDKLRRFVAALASRYDGNPNIAFIDIRSYGNCGEDNVAVWSGLSAMREIAPEKLRAHVQIYMDAFQRTPLCLTWGAADFSEIYDWAAAKGVWLRHDGVCGASDGHELALCDGHVPAVFECSGEYLQMKQVGWWDGKQSVAGVGYTLESSVERGHPSFASLGQAPWDTPQLLKDEPQLLARLSNRLGYNIVLRRAEAPTLLRPGEPARLRLRWENTGVAPMFRRRVLGAALLDNNGRALSVCWPSGSNVSNWVPGKLVNEEMQLVFHDATPGRYMLAIGLFDNIGDAQPSIRLANDMQVLGGWHVLNALSVEAAAAPAR